MKAQRILIVDDEFPTRVAMEKVLQSHGYETFPCRSGKEAVVKIREESFDIFITDFHMQGIHSVKHRLLRPLQGIGIVPILGTKIL